MGDPDDTVEPAPLADVIPLNAVERAPTTEPEPALRSLLGEVLREERLDQDRTLADVARDAAISLPYLSEIERGRKEVSSDLLGAVCRALEVPLVEVLERCADRLRARAQGGSGIQLRAA